jgi:hypothetical protein
LGACVQLWMDWIGLDVCEDRGCLALLQLKDGLYNENLYSTGVEFGLLLLGLIASMVSFARSCVVVPLL